VSSVAITCMGWAATAMFISSYFFAHSTALRITQMLGALLWVIYRALLGAPPVIAANALVIAAAAWTTLRSYKQGGSRIDTIEG
jgi:hypothetical protein